MQNNDLISREALIEDLSYSAPELFFDKDFLLYKIMRQPVIDAEPVKRGKWIQNGTEMICSSCKAEYSIEMEYMYRGCYDDREFEGFNHCPKCGARLEVEND